MWFVLILVGSVLIQPLATTQADGRLLEQLARGVGRYVFRLELESCQVLQARSPCSSVNFHTLQTSTSTTILHDCVLCLCAGGWLP